jgi:hypothetical protein
MNSESNKMSLEGSIFDHVYKDVTLILNMLTSTIVALEHLKAHWAMSVSFHTKCFSFLLFHKFMPLSSRNIQVFRKARTKFKYQQNNSASWDWQMGFNWAFNRLSLDVSGLGPSSRVSWKLFGIVACCCWCCGGRGGFVARWLSVCVYLREVASYVWVCVGRSFPCWLDYV